MRKVISLLSIFLPAIAVYAQSFSINTDGSIADTSAILDVKSAAKGILIPRMQKAARNAIYQPAAGLLVYQSGPDSAGFYFYNGSAWLWLISSATIQGADTLSWKRTGNAGTNPSINFVGTTDNQPLSFRVNNTNAGSIDHLKRSTSLGLFSLSSNTGQSNVAVGDSALKNNTTASNLTAIGFAAMKNNAGGLYNTGIGTESLMQNTGGTHNTATGYLAMRNTTGSFNTSYGAFSLYTNNSGVRNTGLGCSALYFNNSNDNVAVGYEALNQSFSGTRNVAIGSNAMRQHTSGSQNVAVGDSAAYNLAGSYIGNVAVGSGALGRGTGNYSTVIGQFAGLNNIGSWTTIIGVSAGQNNRIAGNVFVGSSAGMNNTNGFGNTFLGDNAGLGNRVGSSNTYVGSFTANNNRGTGNTIIGASSASSSDSANYNTFVGNYAGFQTDASYNTMLGALAGFQNTTGEENVFTGHYAGHANTTGSGNIFSGAYAGYMNGSGNRNVGIGDRALFQSVGDSLNVALGDSAGYSNEGSANVFIGGAAGKNSSSGERNTWVGTQAGLSNTIGSNNTMIGYDANVLSPALTYATAIGSGSRAAISNSVIIGDTSHNVTVGIGTAYPTRAGLVVNTNVGGQTNAMFGSNTTGLSLESNWPGVGFNSYYNGGRRNINNGYSGHLNVDMNIGAFYMLIHGVGTANNIVPYEKGVVVREGTGITGSFTPYTDNVFSLGSAAYRWTTIYATNTIINTSDANEKKNIRPLDYGLHQVMQLRPVSYQWKEKHAGEQTMLGLLAQDVQKVIPEVIVQDKGIYGMRSTELIPVLIKAVQEQQTIIETLQKQIVELKVSVGGKR